MLAHISTLVFIQAGHRLKFHGTKLNLVFVVHKTRFSEYPYKDTLPFSELDPWTEYSWRRQGCCHACLLHRLYFSLPWSQITLSSSKQDDEALVDEGLILTAVSSSSEQYARDFVEHWRSSNPPLSTVFTLVFPDINGSSPFHYNYHFAARDKPSLKCHSQGKVQLELFKWIG